MKVLITGGAGFIGGAVTRQLLARGDEVVALVRDRNRTSGIEKVGAEVVEDDLSDVGTPDGRARWRRRVDPRRRQLPDRDHEG